MFTLLKNALVYTPEFQGEKDILICGERIQAIDRKIEISSPYVNIIDAQGKIAVPGFVDSLVHITGGGGEGGFTTRTPEINLTDLTSAGITTLVAALGTDSVSRTLGGLLAKAKELKEHGISCFIYSGSYHLPVKTLTQDLQSDLCFIEECIGVGEIAISDHRGSQPSYLQLAAIAADARVGGMLSGKGGVVSIHMGPGLSMFNPLYEVVNKTDIPIEQFYPTHINRSQELLDAGIDYTRCGGYIDLTTSSNPASIEMGEIKCSKALKYFLEQQGDISKITFSSDGHASLPEFDENGRLISLEVGSEASLYSEVRDAVVEEGISLEIALKTITSSPADILKLANKGRLRIGNDADINLLDADTLFIESVISRGKIMFKSGESVVKGRFE